MKVYITGDSKLIIQSAVNAAIKESQYDISEIITTNRTGVENLSQIYAQRRKIPVIFCKDLTSALRLADAVIVVGAKMSIIDLVKHLQNRVGMMHVKEI